LKTLGNAISKLPEDCAEAPKHVGASVIIINILIKYLNICMFGDIAGGKEAEGV